MANPLQKQAEDLGIDVDGRWSDETLQEKINEARAKPPAAKPPAAPAADDAKTVPVKLLYDYWDAEGERHPSGEVIGLSIDEAKRLIAVKKAERADPLPGEKR